MLLSLLTSAADALTTVTISDEAAGNNIAGRAAAASLGDVWVAAFVNGVVRPDLFAAAGIHTGSNTLTDIYSNLYQVDWQLGYIIGSGPGYTNIIQL